MMMTATKFAGATRLLPETASERTATGRRERIWSVSEDFARTTAQMLLRSVFGPSQKPAKLGDGQLTSHSASSDPVSSLCAL